MVLSNREFNNSAPGDSRLTTTDWGVVLAAGAKGAPGSEEALEKLCRSYWYPVYAYVRQRGYTRHDAQDLAQEFFARLLERRDFDTVSPEKGKFRSFLLASLNHFLFNEHDRSTAIKRGAGKPLVSLDEEATESRYLHEPATDKSPDKAYDRNWAVALLERALARLGEEFAVDGKGEMFAQLKPFLAGGAEAGDYGPVSDRLGITPGAVAVAVHRLRQRYRDLVRPEVTQTVAGPMEIEHEMRHLRAVLSE
jgi:RNA polymerase sigma-70 factor (ECF subfamily)